MVHRKVIGSVGALAAVFLMLAWVGALAKAHTGLPKAGGSSQYGPNARCKGEKRNGGNEYIPGNIVVHPRGTKFPPGGSVGAGEDHTLYTLVDGKSILTARPN